MAASTIKAAVAKEALMNGIPTCTSAEAPMSDRCHGPFGSSREVMTCLKPARFVVARHIDFPLPVCAEHLGHALLLARNVLWPPRISLVGQ
ncbi:hypothetical protein [Streptomyces sp. L2]|uniref:hypothetical protein n=1 Tax=Streptomyces sp. L2 TaxID=2162665 RepID=UPI001F50ED73|nr:hypothetical protein [Streptomyces sp. L2]